MCPWTSTGDPSSSDHMYSFFILLLGRKEINPMIIPWCFIVLTNNLLNLTGGSPAQLLDRLFQLDCVHKSWDFSAYSCWDQHMAWICMSMQVTLQAIHFQPVNHFGSSCVSILHRTHVLAFDMEHCSSHVPLHGKMRTPGIARSIDWTGGTTSYSTGSFEHRPDSLVCALDNFLVTGQLFVSWD